MHSMIFVFYAQQIRDRKNAILENFYSWSIAQDKYRGKDIEDFLVNLDKRMNDKSICPRQC